MRDIKFRAWTQVGRQRPYMATGDLSLIIKCNNRGGFEKYFADDVVLMQYTGLQDRNGKDIYEDDILRWPGDGEGEQFYAVAWEDGAWWAEGQWLHDLVDVTEVIGNIYENPELLTPAGSQTPAQGAATKSA